MADDQGTTFGEQLRRRRQHAGLTQEALGARAGLTAKGIAALERGRRQRPYRHTIAALADALGLAGAERDEFVGATRPRPMPPAPPPSERYQVPAPPSAIFGRESEIVGVGAALRDGARLITLVGPGGVGKTRLALAVAERVARDFADGAAFVGLAPLATPTLVLPAIAAALGLREEAGRTARDLLHAHLASAHLLLVIDNCEHLLGAALELADLLAHAPRLAMLATSRAPLRLRGEREWAVVPFPPPDLARLPTVGDLRSNAAIALFVARAQEVAPDFALTPANAPAIAAICRRLDGLPLAIELAAARTRLLNPTELLGRLDRSLALLAGGPRDLPARQRTLRDTIAWSYDLLDAASQALFRRLAIFAGGWDLAAAEAMAADHVDADTISTLGTLVEQSLVLAETHADGATRYRMLEGIREFAREQLDLLGEAEQARRQHAEYYVVVAERADPELSGPDQVRWSDRLDQEHDNVRIALPWAIEAGRFDLATRLGWALQVFWATRSHHGEGLRWMEAVLASGKLTPLEEARALGAAGLLVRLRGDFALAVERLQGAFDRFRALDDQPSMLVTLSRLGQAARFQGDYPRAVAAATEGLALARRMGDRERIAWMLDVLGVVALVEGDFSRATAIFEESLTISEQTGDQRYIGGSHVHLSMAALGLGLLERAEVYGRNALTINAALQLQRGIAQALDALASAAAERGDAERAARLYGGTETMREAHGLAAWSTHEHRLYDRYVERARDELGAAEFAAAWERGRATPPEGTIALASAAEPTTR